MVTTSDKTFHMVTISDKTILKSTLEKSFEDFIKAFSAFSDQEVNELFPSSSWTPVQVASHIILASDGVPDNNTEKTDRPYDSMLAKIRPWWTDMNQKFQAPDGLQPDSNIHSKDEILRDMKRIHSKDLSIIESTDLSEICKGRELPGIGLLTRSEWLWFIQMHLERHSYQLRNMRK